MTSNRIAARCLIILLVVPQFLGATELPQEVDSLASLCIDVTFVSDYQEAYRICDRLEQLMDGPMAPCHRSAVMAGEMIDFEDTSGLGRFLGESQRCIEIAESRIAAGTDVAEDYFYMGSTLAYVALLYGHQGSYWKAYRAAVRSRHALETCLELDSTFVDARIGIGNYQYWMSRSLEFLNWLPVIRDEKKAGIAQLQRVIAQDTRARYLAISSLANIRLDQGEYSEALRLARLGLARYPDSRAFLWQEGAAELGMGSYARAIDIYHELLAQILSLPRNNRHNELSCYASLVVGYYELRQYSTCIETARRALQIPLTEDLRRNKKKTLDKIIHYLGLAEQEIDHTR